MLRPHRRARAARDRPRRAHCGVARRANLRWVFRGPRRAARHVHDDLPVQRFSEPVCRVPRRRRCARLPLFRRPVPKRRRHKRNVSRVLGRLRLGPRHALRDDGRNVLPVLQQPGTPVRPLPHKRHLRHLHRAQHVPTPSRGTELCHVAVLFSRLCSGVGRHYQLPHGRTYQRDDAHGQAVRSHRDPGNGRNYCGGALPVRRELFAAAHHRCQWVGAVPHRVPLRRLVPQRESPELRSHRLRSFSHRPHHQPRAAQHRPRRQASRTRVGRSVQPSLVDL